MYLSYLQHHTTMDRARESKRKQKKKKKKGEEQRRKKVRSRVKGVTLVARPNGKRLRPGRGHNPHTHIDTDLERPSSVIRPKHFTPGADWDPSSTGISPSHLHYPVTPNSDNPRSLFLSLSLSLCLTHLTSLCQLKVSDRGSHTGGFQ